MEPARDQQGFRVIERAGPRSLSSSLAGSQPGHGSEPDKVRAEKPQEILLRELHARRRRGWPDCRGAAAPTMKCSGILNDPVGRRALDRLLINEQTVQDNPDLKRSFAAYITPDGHRARIDLTQANRIFSHDAMDQVLTLRRRLKDYLGEYQGILVSAKVAGTNAESADIRALTESDQVQSWFVVPIGVFLVLIVALRDPLACVNLVATMILTYAFALGTTHLFFVTILGRRGARLEGSVFPVRAPDRGGCRLQRLPHDATRRGIEEARPARRHHPGDRPHRRFDQLGRGHHGEQLCFIPLQSAGLAPPARLRTGGRHPDRRRPGPPAPGPLRPLAAPTYTRSARATRVIRKGRREYAIIPD